jgi:hypothetical protein
LRLACLLQIHLSCAIYLLPGSMSREKGRCVHGFWKDQVSLVVQLVTNVLPICSTDILDQLLARCPHLVGCCLVSIVEHVVLECLSQPTPSAFCWCKCSYEPSSTTPTSVILPRPPRPLLFPLCSAHVVGGWKSLFTLPMLRSVSSSPVDVAVDEISPIPATF